MYLRIYSSTEKNNFIRRDFDDYHWYLVYWNFWAIFHQCGTSKVTHTQHYI